MVVARFDELPQERSLRAGAGAGVRELTVVSPAPASAAAASKRQSRRWHESIETSSCMADQVDMHAEKWKGRGGVSSRRARQSLTDCPSAPGDDAT